ncbi:MAG: zinc ribbon domain-containing protein [Bacteroidales bacterium]|nr:zinc ribbon domain-containing protein [Bacteroidales bacterium]
MICKFCNSENRDGAAFCVTCGSRLDGRILCSECGRYTAPGLYCDNCGAAIGVKKKRCTRCGTIFTGERCPNCNPEKEDTGDGSSSLASFVRGADVSYRESGSDRAKTESPAVKKRCTRCGTIFTGERCPNCYAEKKPAETGETPRKSSVPEEKSSSPAKTPSPANPGGAAVKKRCTKCGTIFTGDRCPNCSAATKKPASASARTPAPRAAAVATTRKKTGRDENLTEDVYQRNRVASAAFAVVGLIGIVAVLVFMFLIGWKVTIEAEGDGEAAEIMSESRNIFYFFGAAYDGIDGRRAYTNAVTGSVICGAMMLATVALAVVCVIKFASSLKSENYRPYVKYLVMTYLLFFAFAMMLRSFLSFGTDETVGAGFESLSYGVGLSFGWAFYAAVITGGVLVAVSYVGGTALAYRSRPRYGAVKRYVLPLATVLLIVLSAVFMSGKIVKLAYSYGEDGFTMACTYGLGYMYWVSAFDNQAIFTYAFIAELATCLYMPFAMLVATKLLLHVYNPMQKNGFIFEGVLSSVFFVAAAVFAALLFGYVSGNTEISSAMFGDYYIYIFDSLEESATMNLLYIGAACYAAAFALCAAHMVLKPQKPSGRREKIVMSNRIYN